MTELKIEKFDQIGILTKDIEKAAGLYKSLFKFRGNVDIIEQDAKVVCRGQEGTYRMKKIMDFFGGKQLEIVEILEAEGPNLYSEFLKEDKFGLHHLGIYVKDAKALIEKFKTLHNIDIAQVGKLGKLTFTYLDTRPILGYYLELLEF
ncbi:MAG: hypothetical protein EU544_01880 [Promethearchaeota archaeon]|nr:MAG: hypothetical protein EU544_01880 [Candidatus Lokiarchaeota archaeon]